MKENLCNKSHKKHTFQRVAGILTIGLLMFVGIVGAAPFAYVINADYPSGINVIDTATNKVIFSVEDVSGYGVAVNPTGTKVYVANYMSGTVSVIDTTTNKVTSTVKVGSNPKGIAVNPAGTKVYVANMNSNIVSVIDTVTNKVISTVKVGSAPEGIAVSTDGKSVFVTNSGDKSVSVIDTATNKATSTINVGSSPGGIAASPNGKKVYVANAGSNSVSVIDTTTNKVSASVTLSTSDGAGFTPYEVAITPDGKKVYVAGQSSGDNYDDVDGIPVIDTSTNKVITIVDNGELGTTGVAITPDGKKVYVLNQGQTGAGYGVSVINTVTNKVTDHVDSDGYMLVASAFGQFIGPSVTFLQKPVAAFTASPTSGTNPLKVQFTDQSTNNPTSWKWDFGDGSATSTTHNPLHTYIKAGSHTVTLIATNAAGSSNITKTKYITLTGSSTSKPVAAFTASPTSGTIPLKVQFTDQSTNNPTSWKWDFGDGSATSTTHNPLHTYIKAGTHKVTLTATNAAGSSTITKTAYIKVTTPIKPVAAFTATPTSGKASLKVQFTDKSTNSPTSWKWTFGDGTTSTTKSPLHTYTKKGKFTVTLTVKNTAGSNTKTMTSYITVT